MTDCEFDIKMGTKFPYDATDAWNDAYPESPPVPAVDWAHTAARAILHDLTDRRGVRNELDGLDEDIRFEIVASIAEIIRLSASTRTPCNTAALLARIAELEAENELLRSDVDSLLNGEFTEEDWERYRDALPA